MSIGRDNFQSWFIDVLSILYKENDSGFAVVMIAFPIIERYLRQSVGLAPEQNLSDEFFESLCKTFPDLQTGAKAKEFWRVYRDGLLHQVTFSPVTKNRVPLPRAALSNEVGLLYVDSNGHFFLNPKAFAKRVIEVVVADFSTFEGQQTSSAPPLPMVFDVPAMGLTGVSGAVGYVLGTASPPPRKP